MKDLAALIVACAINTHPTTVSQVIRVESGGNTLAVNINGPIKARSANSFNEAVARARLGLASGYSVDVGLMQINSANFRRFGLTVESAFDPCKNISAGSTILLENYTAAKASMGPGQPALLSALSRYNTGSPSRGFSNGYVARYISTRPVGGPSPSVTAYADPYTASSSVERPVKEMANDQRP